jgi:phosphate transport system substrate-binding protein
MTNDFNFIECPRCEYRRNPATAQRCEVCGASLKKGLMPLMPLVVGLSLLGVIGAGAFLLNDMFFSTEPSVDSSSAPTVPASPTAANSDASNASPEAKVRGVVVQSYAKFADVPNVPKGIFNYGGATTFAPLRTSAIVSQFNQSFPQFQLRYTEPVTGNPGSNKGIAMLIDGQLSIAQSSRPLKPNEFATAQARGFALDSVPVALDGIALFVNPILFDQGVKALSIAQVQDIFTGAIENWQAVGGPNIPITAISHDPSTGGTADFFIENVLAGQPLGKDVNIVRDTTTSIRQVAVAPGGIGFATAAESINQRSIRLLALSKNDSKKFISPCTDASCTEVNALAFTDGSYPITRRLFVILKRDGQLDEQAGVAYANLLLSDEGQELIKKVGFVPIR